jgi:hypothetical protein
MAHCGFLNVKISAGGDWKTQAHNDGRTRPREALGRAEYQDRSVIRLRDQEQGNTRANDLLKEADAIPRAGRKGARRMFVLIGGPPAFEASDAWKKERVQEWAETAVAFVEKTIGKDAVLESANLHVDERSPHIHLTVIPGARDDKGRKLSAKVVQRRMAGLGDTGREHGSVVMRTLQDRFYAGVSKPFDLGRKRPGAKLSREEPDRAKGLTDRLADTQRQVEDLQRRSRVIVRAGAREREVAGHDKARARGRERRQPMVAPDAPKRRGRQ